MVRKLIKPLLVCRNIFAGRGKKMIFTPSRSVRLKDPTVKGNGEFRGGRVAAEGLIQLGDYHFAIGRERRQKGFETYARSGPGKSGKKEGKERRLIRRNRWGGIEPSILKMERTQE